MAFKSYHLRCLLDPKTPSCQLDLVPGSSSWRAGEERERGRMAGEGDDLDALYGDVAGDGKGDPARAEGDPTSAAGEAPSANLDEVYQTYEPSKVGAKVGAAPQKQDPAAANRTGTGGGGGSVAVYVANLQWWTTDAEVESACAEFGRVAGLKFFEEKSNGKSKGYALVTFVDSADADACLQGLNG